MKPEALKRIIEAALMALPEPLSVQQLAALFEPEPPPRSAVRAALHALQQDYAGRGVILQEVASGFRFQVHGDCAMWINKLFAQRPPRYSRALLETLAIITYKQPLTRAEIEEIRGVGVNANIIRSLQEREWIKVVGHRDVPGKPELLATTRQFLDYFNLKKLAELPPLAEIKDFETINPDLFAALERAARPPPHPAGLVAVPVNENEHGHEGESSQAGAAVEQALAAGGEDNDAPAANDNIVPFSNPA